MHLNDFFNSIWVRLPLNDLIKTCLNFWVIFLEGVTLNDYLFIVTLDVAWIKVLNINSYFFKWHLSESVFFDVTTCYVVA